MSRLTDDENLDEITYTERVYDLAGDYFIVDEAKKDKLARRIQSAIDEFLEEHRIWDHR